MENTQTNRDIGTFPTNIADRFQTAIEQNELAHAYLLVGPSGAGKTQLAQWVAMRLFCKHVDENGQPDGTCEECQRIINHLHPDVLTIAPDGRQIKVDQIRFLKSEFSKSAVEGNQKVFIIQDADKMTVSAANSLLKFLEEPASDFVAFLITTNKGAILPTVQSRAQIVEFAPLSFDKFKQQLVDQGVDADVINLAASLTNSLDDVMTLLEDEWLEKAQNAVAKWFKLTAKADMQAFISVSQDIMPVVKDRNQQQTIFDMIMLVWRDTMLTANQDDLSDRISFVSLQSDIRQTANQYSPSKLTKTAQMTLQTRRLLDQNINFQNILEELTIKIVSELSNGAEV